MALLPISIILIVEAHNGSWMFSPHFQILFEVFGFLWVGGGGFLFYRYPDFFARMNTRVGFKRFSGPRFISFTRKAGIFYMALAVVSAILMMIIKP